MLQYLVLEIFIYNFNVFSVFDAMNIWHALEEYLRTNEKVFNHFSEKKRKQQIIHIFYQTPTNLPRAMLLGVFIETFAD